jgi:hypothetical protein
MPIHHHRISSDAMMQWSKYHIIVLSYFELFDKVNNSNFMSAVEQQQKYSKNNFY